MYRDARAMLDSVPSQSGAPEGSNVPEVSFTLGSIGYINPILVDKDEGES